MLVWRVQLRLKLGRLAVGINPVFTHESVPQKLIEMRRRMGWKHHSVEEVNQETSEFLILCVSFIAPVMM